MKFFKVINMKKILIGLFILVGLCSCTDTNDEINDTNDEINKQYLVEEKIKCWDETYKIVISDLETKRLRVIHVGKYTYKITNPGDTITIKRNTPYTSF